MSTTNLALERVGKSRKMNNGMMATIIEYNGCNNCMIQFEDGTVVKNRLYGDFLKGEIANPNIKSTTSLALERTGETRRTNNGIMATIIEYVSSNNCTIQFEDGTIIRNRDYKSFLNGNISNRCNNKPKDRIGQRRQMNNGMAATIIEYNKHDDCAVQFDDGIIVRHKSYKNFLIGNISNPNLTNATKHIGETRIMNNGMATTITEYNGCNNCVVRFKDGTIIKDKTYGNFLKGNIANPNITDKTKYIGETRTMNNGMSATIIGYNKYSDCTIRFKDGTIVNNKSYVRFLKGTIANPNIKNTLVERNKRRRIGERKKMNCGLYATITEYNSNNNCTICFDDGAVANNVQYNSFINSAIGYPYSPSKKTPVRMGNVLLTGKAYIYNGEYNFFCNCSICGLRDIMTIKEAQGHVCEKKANN